MYLMISHTACKYTNQNCMQNIQESSQDCYSVIFGFSDKLYASGVVLYFEEELW